MALDMILLVRKSLRGQSLTISLDADLQKVAELSIEKMVNLMGKSKFCPIKIEKPF